jgi:sugar lactone lactonase YvrE/DNA-directed RNA polymerase subunit RPC12/RpoP
MPAESFDCPNCGAPLDAHDLTTPTIRCPFCGTVVIVPDELRAEPEPAAFQTVTVARAAPAQAQARGLSNTEGRWLALIGFAIVFITLGGILLPILLSTAAVAGVSLALPFAASATPSPTPTRTPTLTVTPTPTATPAYMIPDLSFGEQGIGPGKLNDARYIDLDQQGAVYVADYQGGRVQVFDTGGQYLRQWRLGGQNTIIAGLAADRQGRVFVAAGNGIAGVDGQSGEIVAEIVNPAGGTYGDLVVDAQGRLAATWYEGRWGMITSLEGHRESLIFYNPAGQPVLDLPSFISDQTGGLALDNFIAVDGRGTIYALSGGAVYKFAPEGRFLDRWEVSAGAGGGSALGVDGQGRVYVAGSRAVFIYSPEGRLEQQFPVAGVWDLAAADDGSLWVLGRDRVTRYVVSGW